MHLICHRAVEVNCIEMLRVRVNRMNCDSLSLSIACIYCERRDVEPYFSLSSRFSSPAYALRELVSCSRSSSLLSLPIELHISNEPIEQYAYAEPRHLNTNGPLTPLKCNNNLNQFEMCTTVTPRFSSRVIAASPLFL